MPNDPEIGVDSEDEAAELARLSDEISALPESERRKLAGIVVSAYREEMFRGPIPHPDSLAGYENILSGSADRIITMAELQSEHRRTIERKVVESHAFAEKLGVVFAGSIGLTAVLGGIVLIGMGSDAGGIAAIISALAALTGVYIRGKSKSEGELDGKRRQAPDPGRDEGAGD